MHSQSGLPSPLILNSILYCSSGVGNLPAIIPSEWLSSSATTHRPCRARWFLMMTQLFPKPTGAEWIIAVRTLDRTTPNCFIRQTGIGLSFILLLLICPPVRRQQCPKISHLSFSLLIPVCRGANSRKTLIPANKERACAGIISMPR